jgi:hypothetical protein
MKTLRIYAIALSIFCIIWCVLCCVVAKITGKNYTTGFSSIINPLIYEPLTYEQLEPIIEAGKKRWMQVSGGKAEKVAYLLKDTKYQIVQFKDGKVGGQYWCESNIILIDVDAGGAGWFIDPTPLEDEEYKETTLEHRLEAKLLSKAFCKLDLLTVVMHEQGHRLGYEHIPLNSFFLMSSSSSTSVRMLPSVERIR